MAFEDFLYINKPLDRWFWLSCEDYLGRLQNMAVFVIWHGAGQSCKEKSGWLNWLGAECHGGRYCLSHSAHNEQTFFPFVSVL